MVGLLCARRNAPLLLCQRECPRKYPSNHLRSKPLTPRVRVEQFVTTVLLGVAGAVACRSDWLRCQDQSGKVATPATTGTGRTAASIWTSRGTFRDRADMPPLTVFHPIVSRQIGGCFCGCKNIIARKSCVGGIIIVSDGGKSSCSGKRINRCANLPSGTDGIDTCYTTAPRSSNHSTPCSDTEE